VTAIVDVPGVGPELAKKWARSVAAALHTKAAARPAMRADVVYDPERAHLKIVVVGPPSGCVNLLSLIHVWLEQLTV
jgi:hypothetical protein